MSTWTENIYVLGLNERWLLEDTGGGDLVMLRCAGGKFSPSLASGVAGNGVHTLTAGDRARLKFDEAKFSSEIPFRRTNRSILCRGTSLPSTRNALSLLS